MINYTTVKRFKATNAQLSNYHSLSYQPGELDKMKFIIREPSVCFNLI